MATEAAALSRPAHSAAEFLLCIIVALELILMTQPELSPKALIQAAARQLRQEFADIQATNPHAGESGAEAEIVLKRFLKDRVPRRFDVESGVVIGTAGVVSRQTDLIVYDALNSPIYRNGPRLYIIPRDNVAAVIEVKSKLSKISCAMRP